MRLYLLGGAKACFLGHHREPELSGQEGKREWEILAFPQQGVQAVERPLAITSPQRRDQSKNGGCLSIGDKIEDVIGRDFAIGPGV